ncbi:hypothetical protein FQN51_000578 [Onygenales sp. PD_10]|nr:hypothetical protein FQN51_000578 [Onygenales sp. PD_10]
MPIFRDKDPNEPRYHPTWPSSSGAADNENIRPPRTPVGGFDNVEDEIMAEAASSGANMEPYSPQRLQTSDREELIRSIKKGESPTWVPNRSLEEYFAKHGDPPHSRLEGQRKEKSPPLLPAAEIQESPKADSRSVILSSPCEIERPRSALHSGDFREGSPQHQKPQNHNQPFEPPKSHGPFGSSPTTPWFPPASPPRPTKQDIDLILASRARAPSLTSFSSSFVLKAPTSPLVHQANNTDLDFSPKIDPMDLSMGPEKANRRRTLTPETFGPFQSSPPGHLRGPAPSRSWRREATFPYQAHQPRRSLTSTYTLQPASSPHTPSIFRSRRPSFSSDVSSPLHHASMVGSYEESILRGRMSTSPSKPLDFTAQIGVLGRGNCKPTLKCPPHVTVPFPAVFYSYPTSGSGRSIEDDSPSPYVGFIDIESSLPNEGRGSHRNRRRHTSPFKQMDNRPEGDNVTAKAPASIQQERRRREKRSRRSESPKAPPGGSYRIPQQGQLQIIIKNPNKTAVKLFLVPYDLEGMEPGSKTFIRQRSYSAGPIIDMPLSARTNLGTDRPEASLGTGENLTDKPILRYLIHLNICSPSRGRFYLYSGIRVVFANRVPDGKEKLRNEVQYPGPRYSPYKPNKEIGMGSAGSKLAAEKAFRRRSSGAALTSRSIPQMSDFSNHESDIYAPPLPPLHPADFRFPPLPAEEAIQSPSDFQPRIDPNIFNTRAWFGISPTKPNPNPPSTQGPSSLSFSANIPSSPSSSSNSGGGEMYSKRQKGDVGYGGAFGMSSSGNEAGESLLARKLRNLDVVLKPDDSSGEEK